MTQIALIYNNKHSGSLELCREIAAYIKSKGVDLHHPEDNPGFSVTELGDYCFDHCDAVIVLGGDGTLLSAARQVAPCRVPLFGINLGRIGFLSAVEKEDARQAVDSFLAGDYHIGERLLLKAEINRGGQIVSSCTAFNDVVVASGGDMSRAVPLDLLIDNEQINSYHADGIIVSTPTGSTGYSLSAGGPIVLEKLDIMIITPVCPHTFFSRPIIAGANSQVKIINCCDSNTISLTADGQLWQHLELNDEITITRDKHRVMLIHFRTGSYFKRIKEKLLYQL